MKTIGKFASGLALVAVFGRALFKKGIISESEFQTYEVAYDSAKEELAAAQTNLQLVKEGIAQSRGAAVNTLIRSTIDGMVLDVPVEEDNFVIETNNFNSGTTIATVADMGEMIFQGKVDESEVGRIRTGMDLILAKQTACLARGSKFNAKITGVRFCLCGLWPKIQATCFAGGR